MGGLHNFCVVNGSMAVFRPQSHYQLWQMMLDVSLSKQAKYSESDYKKPRNEHFNAGDDICTYRSLRHVFMSSQS